jgi:hypothetical protein
MPLSYLYNHFSISCRISGHCNKDGSVKTSRLIGAVPPGTFQLHRSDFCDKRIMSWYAIGYFRV